jgi:beta-glucosidase
MSDALSSLRPDFVWGVATSSYQIEGAAREDGRGVSIWDTFARTPGAIDDGSNGDVACDHYHRWREDLDLMADLGVDAYRFSVAWPRILPAGRGPVEPRGLDFYERLVDGLLERGIAPYATLYHWDLPQALQDAGGWAARDAVEAFGVYVAAVAERLGDRVRAYATLNEPWCSAHLGYGLGEHAPGLSDLGTALQAAHHLLLAHGRALPILREHAPEAEHGIVLNLNPTHPASDDPADRDAAVRFDGYFNRWFLDPLLRGRYPEDAWAAVGSAAPTVEPGDMETIAAPLDWLGVNYYSRAVCADAGPEAAWPRSRGVAVDAPVTAMGWEIYPEGLHDILTRLPREYGDVPPLYVTENGAAVDERVGGGQVDDAARIDYLAAHVDAVARAARDGVDVRGYFAWSLMDNFEWARGYEKRFGLVRVDYDTLERTPKASADWFRDLLRRHRSRPALT